MSSESGSLLVVLLGFVLAFVSARILGARWRARRRERAQQAARAGETRQVRRARERRQGK
jgi:type II secretory pathway pseudopilin PulG